MSKFKGRQIFSHLEGQESLPAKLYTLSKKLKNYSMFNLCHNKNNTLERNLPYSPKYNVDNTWKKREEPDYLFEFTGIKLEEIELKKSKQKNKSITRKTTNRKKVGFSLTFKN